MPHRHCYVTVEQIKFVRLIILNVQENILKLIFVTKLFQMFQIYYVLWSVMGGPDVNGAQVICEISYVPLKIVKIKI